MDTNCSSCFQDAMDKLWFHENTLFPSTTATLLNTEPHSCSTPATEKSTLLKSAAAENKNSHPVGKEKRPTRLSIVTGQPLFQLQPPPRRKIHPSSHSVHTDMKKEMKNSKSLSELEIYEVKGFMNRGFVSQREKLSPQMMSMLPGLQRLGKKADQQDIEERRVTRPYLSEAWFVNRLEDPPLLNLHRLPKSSQGADIKNQLRFWAQKVAASIHEKS